MCVVKMCACARGDAIFVVASVANGTTESVQHRDDDVGVSNSKIPE